MTRPEPFYTSEHMPYLSKRARAQLAAIEAKEARGEPVGWADLVGIVEPNPDLPDCQSEDRHANVQCELPNHHEGPHTARLEWS